MKKAIYWIIGGLIALGSFLLGFLIRQPQINKLKKQVELLQKMEGTHKKDEPVSKITWNF